MYIFPAIDIIGGRVVRLSGGDYGKSKDYRIAPLEAAKKFADEGATHLHLVDLDGAKSGKAENARIIEEIVCKCKAFVEVGGGIRTFEQIRKYVESGVKRVILGTVAVKDFDFLLRALEEFGDIIAVGVDAKDGSVAVSGWEEVTKVNSLEFCRKLKSVGVANVIYTDIGRDGMLNGANLEIYNVLCQTYYPQITASGGITEEKELKMLNDMGIYGAILGKSLYENKINLRRAVAIAEVK